MNRISALAGIARTNQADAILLTGEVNLIYALKVTALEGQCLICADGTAVFITDGRYTEVAETQLVPRGFRVLTRSNATGFYDFLRPVLDEYNIHTLMYEDDVLTVAQFALLRDKLPCSFIPLNHAVLRLRAQKSEDEILHITAAQRIAEQALARLHAELYTGITEQEAAARLNYYMALGGSEKPSFDTILLFGENTSRPHGVPGDRKLRPGDFVLADFGAVCHGYHSDMTRTVAYGTATDEMRTVYETVLAAQAAAQAAASAGRLCNEMHIAAADVIAQAGFGAYFTHALGHSVGLEIHEMPVAAPRCEEVLRDGIVMTDEPGIYMPGKFGIRIEDMLVIAGEQAVNLTQYPKAFTVLPERTQN